MHAQNLHHAQDILRLQFIVHTQWLEGGTKSKTQTHMSVCRMFAIFLGLEGTLCSWSWLIRIFTYLVFSSVRLDFQLFCRACLSSVYQRAQEVEHANTFS